MIGQMTVTAQVADWEARIQQEPENVDLLLYLGRHYHDEGGTSSVKNAVKKAEDYLSRLLEIEPGHPVALVYIGSVYTMKARDTFLPWNKMKHMKKGFSRMDKAVDLAPHHPEVRLIRGINSVNVPDMFSRLSLAMEDFEAIEKIQSEKSVELNSSFLLPYTYYHGLVLKKSGKSDEAKMKFQKVLEIDAESPYAQRASKALETWEEAVDGSE